MDFCQHNTGSTQLTKKKRGTNTGAPQCHSELTGVVSVVFGVPVLELRTLASRKLEGRFREVLLKTRPPDLEEQRKQCVQWPSGDGATVDHSIFPSVFPEPLRATQPAAFPCRLCRLGIQESTCLTCPGSTHGQRVPAEQESREIGAAKTREREAEDEGTPRGQC